MSFFFTYLCFHFRFQEINPRNYLVLQRNIIPAQKQPQKKKQQATRMTKWRRGKSNKPWTAIEPWEGIAKKSTKMCAYLVDFEKWQWCCEMSTSISTIWNLFAKIGFETAQNEPRQVRWETRAREPWFGIVLVLGPRCALCSEPRLAVDRAQSNQLRKFLRSQARIRMSFYRYKSTLGRSAITGASLKCSAITGVRRRTANLAVERKTHRCLLAVRRFCDAPYRPFSLLLLPRFLAFSWRPLQRPGRVPLATEEHAGGCWLVYVYV